MGKAKQMYSLNNKSVYLRNTAILAALFCASAAQANVYKESGTLLPTTIAATAGAPVDNHAALAITSSANVTAPAWLAVARPSVARFSTTLRLTLGGLAAPFAQAPALVSPEALANLETLAESRDPITTASVPAAGAAAKPAVRAYEKAVGQDRALFGAHRIRFGKIASGARISGLIRKASASGASAICINRCAELADSLALPGAGIAEQLGHVSASVNAIVAYRTDADTHGRIDQWSTPNETLARKAGDCEDYAILKMAVLARLGVPVDAMEIVVLKDTSRRLFHAILVVATPGASLVLDNMTDAVLEDTARPQYAPLFSLSGSANYIFGYKGGKQDLLVSIKNIAAIAPGAGF